MVIHDSKTLTLVSESPRIMSLRGNKDFFYQRVDRELNPEINFDLYPFTLDRVQ